MRLYQPQYRNGAGELVNSPVWSVDFFVEGGRRIQRSTKETDLRAAKRVATRMVAEERKAAEEGAMSPGEARKLRTAPLLDEYVLELKRQNRDEVHVKRTKDRCTFMLATMPRLADLTRPKIRAALGRVAERRTKRPREKGEGRLPSPQTVNAYRVSLHAFCQWLVEDAEKLSHNPVATIKRVKVTGPTLKRRALTVEEFDRLLAAVPDTQYGRERRLVYEVARSTGFRRAELEALTVACVSIQRARVTLSGDSTKNADEAVQHLPPSLLERLGAFVEGREPGEPLFRAIPTVQTLRQDLTRAELGFTHEGGRFDFHALRGQLCTDLARAGVPLATAQRIMRHSTPVLTSNVYTKVGEADARAAAAALDALRGTSTVKDGVKVDGSSGIDSVSSVG